MEIKEIWLLNIIYVVFCNKKRILGKIWGNLNKVWNLVYNKKYILNFNFLGVLFLGGNIIVIFGGILRVNIFIEFLVCIRFYFKYVY